MMKNKRGQGISMNMIIIIILAILVLLVVSIIFLGGAGTLNQRLRNIFGGSAGAYDADIARSLCVNYCDVAKTLPTAVGSAYCVHVFTDVDSDGDGVIDGDFVCDITKHSSAATGPSPYFTLGVGCDVTC